MKPHIARAQEPHSRIWFWGVWFRGRWIRMSCPNVAPDYMCSQLSVVKDIIRGRNT